MGGRSTSLIPFIKNAVLLHDRKNKALVDHGEKPKPLPLALRKFVKWISNDGHIERRRLASIIDSYERRRSLRAASDALTVSVDAIECLSGGDGRGLCNIFWGYNNPTDATVRIPVGGGDTFGVNMLAIADVTPPEDFLPGRWARVFNTTVSCFPCDVYEWTVKASESAPFSKASANPCFPPSTDSLLYDKQQDKCRSVYSTVTPGPAMDPTPSYEWGCEDLSAAGASCANLLETFSGVPPVGAALKIVFPAGASYPFKFTCKATLGSKTGTDAAQLDSVPSNGPTVLVTGPFDAEGVQYLGAVPWMLPLKFFVRVASNAPPGAGQPLRVRFSIVCVRARQ
eukprot:tig00021504_g21965.t1